MGKTRKRVQPSPEEIAFALVVDEVFWALQDGGADRLVLGSEAAPSDRRYTFEIPTDLGKLVGHLRVREVDKDHITISLAVTCNNTRVLCAHPGVFTKLFRERIKDDSMTAEVDDTSESMERVYRVSRAGLGIL